MGMLDSLIGGVLGGSGTANSGMTGVLGSLLGGSSGGGAAGLLGGLTGGNAGGTSPMAGGLAGLVAQFERAGLGNMVQSWIGTGPNESVSPDQLHQVLGQEQVDGMAKQADMPPTDLLSQLSQHLPRLIDAMTPGGQVQNPADR